MREDTRAILVCFAVCTLIVSTVPNLTAGNNRVQYAAGKGQWICQAGDTWVHAGSVYDLQTLNPCNTADAFTSKILALVYDALVYVNETTNAAEPALATNWTSTDGLTWTVHLRENVKWHDGQPLTADDVVFTYNLMLNPSAPLRTSEYFSHLKWTKIPGSTDMNETYWEAVQKIDAQNVKFVLEKPVWDFGVTILTLPILKKEIWRTHWTDAKTWDVDYNSTTGSSRSIGTGPYKLSSWKSGEEIVLSPNTDYYKNVNLGIIITEYNSMEALVSAMKQQAVQIVFHPIPWSYVPEVSQIVPFTVFTHPSNEITFIGFNLEKYFEGYDEGSSYEPRSSPDDPITYPIKPAGSEAGLSFRTALAYAIDHAGLDTNFVNVIHSQNALVQSSNPYYNASIKTYNLDLQRAISILNSANYKDLDGDGWREDYSGREMGHDGVVKIYIQNRNMMNLQIAMQLCANLRSIGVNADTEPIPVINIRDYDLFLCTVSTSPDFEYIYKLLATKYDYTDGVRNGENLWRYRNPDTDNLTNAMLEGNNFAGVIKNIQGVVSNHLPVLPLYSSILHEVIDQNTLSVFAAENESILAKHNLLTLTYRSEKTVLGAAASPYMLNAASGTRTEVTVELSGGDNNPMSDVEVILRIFPSNAISADAGSKITDSKGRAVFTLTLTKTLNTTQLVEILCSAGSATKKFYILIEPVEFDVSILSSPFVKGLANNTYTLALNIRNENIPVSNAFVRMLHVSEAHVKPVMKENLSDTAGNVNFEFIVDTDYLENTPLEISYAISTYGGAEQAYGAGFVIIVAGSEEATITTSCSGVQWSTGTGVINASVSKNGAAVQGASLMCAIVELDGVFTVDNPTSSTDNSGNAKFDVRMNCMPAKSRTFDYYILLCTNDTHGLVYSRSVMNLPATIEVTVASSDIEIQGVHGTETTLTVSVHGDGGQIPSAEISAWKSSAYAGIQISGIPCDTNTSGSATIGILITADFHEDVNVSVFIKAVFWGMENACEVHVRVIKASLPGVKIEISSNEIEGVAGNSVSATVHVEKDNMPVASADAVLVLGSKTNLAVTPENAKTDANGNATFEIELLANFTKMVNISVSARVTVNSTTYTSNTVYLTIYPAGASVDYVVTLSSSVFEISGKQGSALLLTGNVKKNDVGISGLNYTILVSGTSDLLIEPQTCTTDANGNAYFTLTITRNIETQIEIKLTGKVTVGGKDYLSTPVTIKITPYLTSKTPDFDLSVLFFALLLGLVETLVAREIQNVRNKKRRQK